jgi:hypothetical protein
MPGHRKTAAATRLTANRSLSAPPACVNITKRNRNSSRTARTQPRRGPHDVTASQSLHAAIPQKRLITERQWTHPGKLLMQESGRERSTGIGRWIDA